MNGADKNASTELGKLMHDFFCTSADDMHFKELADVVRYFKEVLYTAASYTLMAFRTETGFVSEND